MAFACNAAFFAFVFCHAGCSSSLSVAGDMLVCFEDEFGPATSWHRRPICCWPTSVSSHCFIAVRRDECVHIDPRATNISGDTPNSTLRCHNE